VLVTATVPVIGTSPKAVCFVEALRRGELRGEMLLVHVVVVPLCTMVKVVPLIVMVPVLAAPVLAATE